MPGVIHNLVFDGLAHFFGQFSISCEPRLPVDRSSAIANAIPSLRFSPSEASRMTEILDEEESKAFLTSSLGLGLSIFGGLPRHA